MVSKRRTLFPCAVSLYGIFVISLSLVSQAGHKDLPRFSWIFIHAKNAPVQRCNLVIFNYAQFAFTPFRHVRLAVPQFGRIHRFYALQKAASRSDVASLVDA